MRVIPDIGPFSATRDAIHMKLIPAFAQERHILSLPCRFGGLGIVNPTDIANFQCAASIKVTSSLKSLIITQSVRAPPPDVTSIKTQVNQDHHSASIVWASKIQSNLPP